MTGCFIREAFTLLLLLHVFIYVWNKLVQEKRYILKTDSSMFGSSDMRDV